MDQRGEKKVDKLSLNRPSSQTIVMKEWNFYRFHYSLCVHCSSNPFIIEIQPTGTI
jgi:hypothetical protein